MIMRENEHATKAVRQSGSQAGKRSHTTTIATPKNLKQTDCFGKEFVLNSPDCKSELKKDGGGQNICKLGL